MCEPPSKFVRQRSNPLILQRMNRRPHRAFVHPITHRALKHRRRHPAGPALIQFRRFDSNRSWLKQVFATPGAAILPLRRDFRPTSPADGGRRNFWHERTANGAAGRKKSATECMTQSAQEFHRRKSHCAPGRFSHCGDISRKITIMRTRVATEVAPQSWQAYPRRRGNSIRRCRLRNLSLRMLPVPYWSVICPKTTDAKGVPSHPS